MNATKMPDPESLTRWLANYLSGRQSKKQFRDVLSTSGIVRTSIYTMHLKVLSVYFDSALIFSEYCRQSAIEDMRRISVLKALSGTNWGQLKDANSNLKNLNKNNY